MNTTVIIISTERRFRGGEFQALLLANGLVDRGIKVSIACNSAGPFRDADCPSARWIRFRHRHGMDLSGCSTLIHEITAAEHPVLLCNDSKALTLGFVISLVKKVPVISVRRVYFSFAKNWVSRMKYRSCARIVTISGAIAERCRTTLPDSRITVIPSATVSLSSTVDGRCMRQRLKLRPDETVCLSVADFTNPGKRFPLLMETAGRLRERYPEFRLVLVGTLPEGSEPLPSWCIATGFSTSPLDYYSAADMYLCTSLHEGLGTAILDAVVRDIPSVAPAAGGTADLFSDEAWLADQTNGPTFLQRCCEILDDPVYARAKAVWYGKRARGRFSLSRVLDDYVNLINELACISPDENVGADYALAGEA